MIPSASCLSVGLLGPFHFLFIQLYQFNAGRPGLLAVLVHVGKGLREELRGVGGAVLGGVALAVPLGPQVAGGQIDLALFEAVVLQIRITVPCNALGWFVTSARSAAAEGVFPFSVS